VPLSSDKVVSTATTAYDLYVPERARLDLLRRYWKGRQEGTIFVPSGAPREVRVMARVSRVNVIPIVIDSLVQSTFVDGFRVADSADGADLEVWRAWQANKMDARQTAVHRATAGYGYGYTVVLPGDEFPVIRPVSPRAMFAVYGEDPDWPMFALENLKGGLWRLIDEEAVYYLEGGDGKPWKYLETREHNLGVTPVVRHLDENDLDFDDEPSSLAPAIAGITEEISTSGQVAPLIYLQDQINLTSFSLKVAEHYGAFKQRYIIGWTAKTEADAMKTAASTLFTLDEDPNDVKLGEWAQTDLGGYLESREASLRHAATLSQTPVHELIGELVNLSAEALAAAEAGRDRKIGERKTLWGESHEQTFWLVGRIMGVEIPEDAQVVWRDTSARAFAATVDGLGKLAQMLGVPPQELWERIPGTTQQDVERFKAAAASGDAFANLTSMLDRQGTPAPPA